MGNLEFCSFCNSPAPKYEGGVLVEEVEYQGKFCKRECFDRWVTFKAALSKVKSNAG